MRSSREGQGRRSKKTHWPKLLVAGASTTLFQTGCFLTGHRPNRIPASEPQQAAAGLRVDRSHPAVGSSRSVAASTLLAAGGCTAILLRRRSAARAAGDGPASLSEALKRHQAEVDEIRRLCPNLPAEYDDTKLVRFALQTAGNPAAAAQNVREVLAWRSGEGAKIVAAAQQAVAKAMESGKWNNDPVLAAAPHQDRIGKYITPSQMLVVSTKGGDLVTCIRAATIDSDAMMKDVSEQEMIEFFLYAREVNTIVAEQRARKSGALTRLISANDLTDVSKFPAQGFQNALTGSAKKAVTLYPGYSGPTVLLNLPWLARMLVGILAPLFPGAVRDKLKFARGPMSYMKDLKDILKEPTKSLFVDDLEAVMKD